MDDLVRKMAKLSGDRLREARTVKGWTLDRLAAETGMNASTIGNYEQGTRRFGDVEADVFARVFGLTPAYWMGLEDLREARMIVASRGIKQEDFLSISGHHSVKEFEDYVKRTYGPRKHRKGRRE